MFAMIFKCFHVFLQVFQKHGLSVPSVFRSMLQSVASNLDISKVDRVLHMLQCDPPAAFAGGGREGAGEAQTSRGVEKGADAV